MGLSPFSRSSFSKDRSYGTPTVNIVVTHKHEKVLKNVHKKLSTKLPNPNPKNWRLIKSQTIGRYYIIEVNYPDCTNYEGNKILMFKDTTWNNLRNQGAIDPHFSDNKK